MALLPLYQVPPAEWPQQLESLSVPTTLHAFFLLSEAEAQTNFDALLDLLDSLESLTSAVTLHTHAILNYDQPLDWAMITEDLQQVEALLLDRDQPQLTTLTGAEHLSEGYLTLITEGKAGRQFLSLQALKFTQAAEQTANQVPPSLCDLTYEGFTANTHPALVLLSASVETHLNRATTASTVPS
jgi:hypothetical protein